MFANLGVYLSVSELKEIFTAIDVDRSSTIDIDEFLYFVQGNSSNMSAIATNLLLNVSLCVL